MSKQKRALLLGTIVALAIGAMQVYLTKHDKLLHENQKLIRELDRTSEDFSHKVIEERKRQDQSHHPIPVSPQK